MCLLYLDFFRKRKKNMQFSLATPEDNKKVLSNATKVKVHLTTGIVEILDKHQDLLGKVSIDIVEVESNDDNKSEKLKFILQEGLVIVSTKGLNVETAQTGVYVYAKRIIEFTPSLSIEEFTKKVDQKSVKLENEKQVLIEMVNSGLNIAKMKTKVLYLEEELAFDKKVLVFIKDSKN